MSLLLIIAKTCLFCSRSKKLQDKTTHQNNLASQTIDYLGECRDDYEEGRCEYEQVEAAIKAVDIMRLRCFECDGKTPMVHEMIRIGPLKAIKEKTETQQTKEKSRRKSDRIKGVKEEGNILRVKSWNKTKKLIEGTK